MAKPTAIMWFRNDLRLFDNPAVTAACDGYNLLPVYVHSPKEEGAWNSGAASNWWLHHSLESLAESLKRFNVQLILRQGAAAQSILELVAEMSASLVVFNKRYEPWAIMQQEKVTQKVSRTGVEVQSFDGNLLLPPEGVLTKEGKPFKVFTPFWRAALEIVGDAPLLEVPVLEPTEDRTTSEPLENLQLLPKKDWADGIRAAWQPGEAGAQKQMKIFLSNGLAHYRIGRDTPGVSQVSRLSPHLHFGEISPNTIWHAIKLHSHANTKTSPDCETYLRELIWREFANHLLYHFPKTTDKPLREEFDQFPWSPNSKYFKAWRTGKTGYPIVDAGMRELWHTGWMHNRVRMVVASFLVKDLLIAWQNGARWFWDTLVDADLANNTLGWQWSAGCGADAAPYFRVFNPILQGEKFDPEGAYVRKWIPELNGLSNKWIHRPWCAPPLELAAAGVSLGVDYPNPIVEHAVARRRALEAFEKIKKRSMPSGKIL